ncbi:PfkB family carbohydrate kinase [Kribbia dieselivorans]|uniref:PfkB family carbohydrate kinase n=1 Tax=Kribbia dieselivorans TaxID=331526 RepID=UPI001FE0D204|nr:PfkB family carbohydrate kinase [Kribbia dieselivorans]
MAARVIHTAQALVDLVVDVPMLPRRGGNVMAQASERYAGGAVTILLAAARSGVQAVHAGGHGTGPNGELVRAVLYAEGIAVTAPQNWDLDTGVCVVLLEPTAERTFVTTQGAERVISVESLAASRPVDGDIVCVSGYSLVPPTVEPMLAWLEGLAAGVHIVLDPGAVFAELPGPLRDRMLAITDVWTSNAEEAEALTGQTSMGEAAKSVAGHLVPGAVAVVRDGAEGCAVWDGADVHVVAGFPQEPVDTNGAGDTHTGVLIAERAKGADWVTAARRANAAGAIKVTRRGPSTAPGAAEIDAFLAAQTHAAPTPATHTPVE